MIDSNSIIFDNTQTVCVSNNLFSNIVSNLKIPEFTRCNPILSKIRGLIVKSIVKYRNHISTLAIERVWNRKRKPSVSISNIDKKEILLEIWNLISSKASKDTGIPTKIIKNLKIPNPKSMQIFLIVLHIQVSKAP